MLSQDYSKLFTPPTRTANQVPTEEEGIAYNRNEKFHRVSSYHRLGSSGDKAEEAEEDFNANVNKINYFVIIYGNDGNANYNSVPRHREEESDFGTGSWVKRG